MRLELSYRIQLSLPWLHPFWVSPAEFKLWHQKFPPCQAGFFVRENLIPPCLDVILQTD